MTGSGSQRTVTVFSGGTATASLPLGAKHVCQIPGNVEFETSSSFVEPTASNKSNLRAVAAFGQNPSSAHSLLFLVGHTDSPGSSSLNQALSERRARSVEAVLRGTPAEWETLFRTEGWSNPELTAMIVETGEASAGDTPAINAAIALYKGSATKRADLFQRYFDALLGISGPAAIIFLLPPWIGCGEDHPLHGDPLNPSRDTTLPPITGEFRPNRRVEFFFFENTGTSVLTDCATYPTWTAACSLISKPPPPKEWFVSASTGQDAPGKGTRRTDPFKTIQFAIDHVTTITGFHLIIVLDGTYVENIRLASKIALKADSGVRPTIQRAATGAPVITCDDVDSVEIQGFTIAGSNQEDGGVLITNSNLVTIKDTRIQQHLSTTQGGGVRIVSSSVIDISDCRVTDNFGPRGGGIAISESSVVSVTGCTIRDNQAGNIGTAVNDVDIDATLGAELDTFTIDLGDAHGGGIYLENSKDVTIRDNIITENQAILFGGGIALDNRAGFAGHTLIEDNEISCNQTAHGPLSGTATCINADMGDPLLSRMEDETLDRVAAAAIRLLHGVGIESGLGGGVALRHVSPSVVLKNNRIKSNLARRGGGVEIYTGAYPRLEANTIELNLSGDDGGGMAIDQFDPFLPANRTTFLGFSRQAMIPRQPVQLLGNQIRSNQAMEDGGGIYATGGVHLEISGSTVIEQNQARENGGGIRISYAVTMNVSGAQIRNNQANVVGNEAEGGGGIAARNSSFHLQNCVLENNISNRFAGGAIFATSAFEGGFNEGGFIANRFGQFDHIMANDYNFHTRRYQLTNCSGAGNQATGGRGAGGSMYAVRVEGDEHLEVFIDGASTAIGQNESHYNNPANAAGANQKRGNVVLELSGRVDGNGQPQDRVNLTASVPPVPTGIAQSTPAPNNNAVVVIRGGGQPDDHPTTFPYSNITISIIDVLPRSGAIGGGTPITIQGTGFLDLPGTQVLIDGQLASNVVVVSSMEITAETPPGNGPGLVDVEVVNADGQTDVVSNGFEYALPPLIIDIQPRSGPAGGGTVITITGSNFTVGADIFIDNVLANNIVVVSDTEITAETPPAAGPGLADVEVNINGQADIVPGGFEYLGPPPLILDLQPRFGPASGFTTITITGQDFAVGAEVFIDGRLANGIVVVSAFEITADTPPLPVPQLPGPVNVEVRNPDQQSDTVQNGYTYQ